MTPHSTSSKKRDRSRFALLIALLVAIPLLVTACANEEEVDPRERGDVVAVTSGPLRISVQEGGDLASGNPQEVKSEVEGRNAIIQLVEEGSYVTKGQRIAVLDRAELLDKINRQQIQSDQALSKVAQARERLAIQEKKNEEDLEDASTRLVLAERALQGYTEGTLPLEIKELESDVMLAKESLKRAQYEAEASQRLYEDEIISKAECEADQLKCTQAEEKVKVAEGRLLKLNEWTSKDELKKLKSEVTVSRLAKERVEQQVRSELAQAKDAVVTAERNHKLELEQLEKYQAQVDKCELFAPADGLVVYAKRSRGRYGGEEPIALGTEVREREPIITIPVLSDLIVEMEIHESSIKKVKKGQRAWITVDALPEQVFPGEVIHVALVPSSQSSWMNPDLKVYETRVRLDETIDGLKPGMHSRVEILVAEFDNTLQVPLQAVRQSGRQSFVYVQEDGECKLRKVDVGENDDSTVQVLGGLDEGELVYISLPATAPPLPEPEEQKFLEPNAAAGGGGGTGEPARRGGSLDDGSLPRPKSADANPGESGRKRGGNMTKEQREAMRKRFENMSEDEKKKLRERMGNRGGGNRRGRRGQ